MGLTPFWGMTSLVTFRRVRRHLVFFLAEMDTFVLRDHSCDAWKDDFIQMRMQ